MGYLVLKKFKILGDVPLPQKLGVGVCKVVDHGI